MRLAHCTGAVRLHWCNLTALHSLTVIKFINCTSVMEQLLGIFRFFFSLRNYNIFMPPLHGKKKKKHLQGKAASCPLTPTGEPSVLFTVKVACHSCVETRDEALSIRLSQQNMFKLCKSFIHRELPGILALR